VTGAGRGLGRRLVRELSATGHRVLATCRVPADGADLGVPVLGLDLRSAASVAALREQVCARLGAWGRPSLDLLVNNAGTKQAAGAGWAASAGPLSRVDVAAVADVVGVNVVGTLAVTQALRPVLTAPGGVVVNLSSQLGSLSRGVDLDYAYNCSKAAVNMLTVSLSRDPEMAGIATVALNPGWSRTDMGGPEAPLDPDEAAADVAALLPRLGPAHDGSFLDRFGEPFPW
jgi:NAD(P)-dependent dehydrogenase (short-subunit alcohol dehydrogenase family)